MTKLTSILILTVCAVNIAHCNRLGDAIRNSTTSKGSTDEDDVLVKETHNFLGECAENEHRHEKSKRNDNRNRKYYGDDSSDSSESNEDSGAYQKGRKNYNRHEDECKEDGRRHQQDERRTYNYRDSYHNSDDYEPQNYGYGYYESDSRRNYDTMRRHRRNMDEENMQCVSQCVFGYLDVLDNNRVPSETLLIKWIQDHYPNDMKRVKALREARRCFARLSTSDAEEGCEFSKALSKCLNLELE